MTHTHDNSPARPPISALPELRPDDTPESRAQRWADFLRHDEDVPESVYDAALARLLEEIRQSL